MKLECESYDSSCELKIFKVNEIEADYKDFGDKYDADCTANDEGYGCGNMIFEAKEPTQKILNKYKISNEEYKEICNKLDEKLSFGFCNFCE